MAGRKQLQALEDGRLHSNRTPTFSDRGWVTAVSSVVVAAAILSSSYTLTKVALRDVPPLTIGFIRFALAAVLLAAWVHVRGYERPGRQDLGRLALGGLLGITLYFSLENLACNSPPLLMLPCSLHHTRH